jgi:hypothetical protein
MFNYETLLSRSIITILTNSGTNVISKITEKHLVYFIFLL